ncbi:MAG: DJ-1/PfpI family protein [Candidatus Micrarchaeota archaeon]
MAKVLFIVAQTGFRDEELAVPKEILEQAKHSVKVASITRMKATGSKGMVIQPDLAVYEANPDFFDCIVVVGGPGSPALAESDQVIGLLVGAKAKGKLIGGICLGPMALAKAGVLEGKDATVFPDRKAINLIRDCGATYVTEPVVIDGNVVTADGPGSASAFGKQLSEMLASKR